MNTILTLYSGIVEENFSNVDGPISTGVQPRKKYGEITGIRIFITASSNCLHDISITLTVNTIIEFIVGNTYRQ